MPWQCLTDCKRAPAAQPLTWLDQQGQPLEHRQLRAGGVVEAHVPELDLAGEACGDQVAPLADLRGGRARDAGRFL